MIQELFGRTLKTRKATEEYFEEHNNRPMFHFVDFGGRIGTKFD
jgi:hypothetical protein